MVWPHKRLSVLRRWNRGRGAITPRTASTRFYRFVTTEHILHRNRHGREENQFSVMTSPVARVPYARQTGIVVLSEKNRTEPSMSRVLTPPEW